MLTSICLLVVFVCCFLLYLNIRNVQKLLELVELNNQKALKDQSELFLVEMNHIKEKIENKKMQRKKGGNPYPRSDEHKRKLSEAANRRYEHKRQLKADIDKTLEETGWKNPTISQQSIGS